MVKINFPKNLIDPIGRFLRKEEEKLKERKKKLDKEDPFKDPDRILDNARLIPMPQNNLAM